MSDKENEVAYSNILASTTLPKFEEIFFASSRQERETCLHRHGVRAKTKSSRLTKPKEKAKERIKELYSILQSEEDHEMAEGVLRNWLLTKRPLLAAALDHMGIEHNNGLTESDDIDKFKDMKKKDIRAMAKKLEQEYANEDVRIYLKYMGVRKVDESLGK